MKISRFFSREISAELTNKLTFNYSLLFILHSSFFILWSLWVFGKTFFVLLLGVFGLGVELELDRVFDDVVERLLAQLTDA